MIVTSTIMAPPPPSSSAVIFSVTARTEVVLQQDYGKITIIGAHFIQCAIEPEIFLPQEKFAKFCYLFLEVKNFYPTPKANALWPKVTRPRGK